MSEEEINTSKRAQIGILQARIGLHGSRMWQLPLTYLGAIAIGLNSELDGMGLGIVFYAMTVLGVILMWCLHGAVYSYTCAVENMAELEKDLSLRQYTTIKASLRYSYYTLLGFGIICCLALAIYFTECNQ